VKEQRFRYYKSTKKHGNLSPASYNAASGFLVSPRKGASFGVSRSSMNKLFVHDVEEYGKKNKRHPGPDAYEPLKTFSTSG